MIAINLKENENLHIGQEIVVTVLESTKTQVKLAIDAPRDVLILRQELIGRDGAQLNNDKR